MNNKKARSVICATNIDRTTRLGDPSRIVAEYFDPAELWLRNRVDDAAESKRLALPPPHETLLYYASQGELEMLIKRWPLDLWPYDEALSRLTAKSGNLASLQWVQTHGLDDEWDWDVLALTAARNGHVNILEWVIDHCTYQDGGDDEITMLSEALKGGHHDAAEWIYKRLEMDGPLNMGKSFRKSAAAGDLCASAAMGGSIKVLRWLRETLKCSWDERTCEAAVRYGHPELLQWARDNGAAWGQDICSIAIQRGHLEILQWLIVNGAPYDIDECISALFLGGDPL